MKRSLITIKNDINTFFDLHLDGLESKSKYIMNKDQIDSCLLMVGGVIRELRTHKVSAFLSIWDIVKNLKALKFDVFAKHTRAEKIYIILLPGFTKLYNRLNNKSLKKMTADTFIDALTKLEAEVNIAIATLGPEKIVPDSVLFDSQSIFTKDSFNSASVPSTSSPSLDYYALPSIPQESSSVTWHPEVQDKIKKIKVDLPSVSNNKKPRPFCY